MGSDRAEAIARLRRALGEYEIQGIHTNIPFFRRVLEHPDFVAGRLDTGFIDRVLAEGLMEEEPPSEEEERVALLAALLHVERDSGRSRRTPRRATDGNTPGGVPYSMGSHSGRAGGLDETPGAASSRVQELEHEVELLAHETANGVRRFRIGSETTEAHYEEITPGVYSLLMNGRSYEASVSKRPGDAPGLASPYVVVVGLRRYLVELRDPRQWRRTGSSIEAEGPQEIVAPMPGKIVKLLVTEGQEVKHNQGLLVIEAMKMQNELRAPRAGRVERVYTAEGQGVETGARLLRLV